MCWGQGDSVLEIHHSSLTPLGQALKPDWDMRNGDPFGAPTIDQANADRNAGSGGPGAHIHSTRSPRHTEPANVVRNALITYHFAVAARSAGQLLV